VADIDATFKQQIFDLPQRKRIPDVHHYREADYLGRTIEISERVSHPPTLPTALARLKPICSDKAALAHLGRDADAAEAYSHAQEIRPQGIELPASWTRYRGPDGGRRLIDGLREAGWKD
jgi:hypothetical protein